MLPNASVDDVLAAVGDITGKFVESCRRLGVRAGIYYLVWGNFYTNMTNTDGGYDCAVDTPQTRAYERLVLCQLEELFQKYVIVRTHDGYSGGDARNWKSNGT